MLTLTCSVVAQGKSVTATVLDDCPECQGDDVVLTLDAFEKLADPSAARIPVEWDFA